MTSHPGGDSLSQSPAVTSRATVAGDRNVTHHDDDDGVTVTVGDVTLRNVHDPSQCDGRDCVIHRHNVTHPLGDTPLRYRHDRHMWEHVCRHGVGHPCVTQVDWWRVTSQEWQAVHGCDGCCDVTWPDFVLAG